MLIPITCQFCQSTKENETHLFSLCPFVRAVRFGSQLTLWPDFISPQNEVDQLKSCLIARFKYPHVTFQLTCPIAITLYVIWYIRNKVIFQNAKMDIAKALILIRNWEREYILSNKHTNAINHSSRKFSSLIIPPDQHQSRAIIHNSYKIFLQIKTSRRNRRSKCFCYGIISLNGMYIKDGFYHPSFNLPKMELLLLALRDLPIDIQCSNGNFQVVAKHQLPINHSKVRLQFKMLWEDIK